MYVEVRIPMLGYEHMGRVTQGGQKRVLDSLKSERQAVVSRVLWVLRNKVRSCARAIQINLKAISPALLNIFKCYYGKDKQRCIFFNFLKF